ncbi:flagellar basal body rod protein FlgB [Inconstantimicrobium porci]|uniref:flagellar basal body rod protein FlgB n=1 Tax=Inconstantimicrobium porci TaxID=2652291 RepID=UPI002409BD81|nr:flagellar basal body rod protein FlgB [Inconstantimicrobium porci]MDD6770671.1 flagellar basal body rod protein FlgB [Inconstantimicrobium porci]
MGIDRINSQDYTYNLIKKGLNVANLRGQVIANNMANINTKNFKRSSVSFEDTLKDVSSEIENKGYVDGASKLDYGQTKVVQDNSTSMRSDGNNVDLEVEKTNQAANTLMYNALITQANNQIKMTQMVINGGR